MTTIDVFAAGDEVSGKTCSVCQTTIVSGERIVFCPHCSLPYHEECWDENGGCAQYGCASAPESVKHDGATDFQPGAWGDEKSCPACHKRIKAQALKCRFCGAVFEHRGTISAREYATREYEGQEYVVARNQVVAVFLVAATGCLAPFALIALGILIFHGTLGKIQYRRLPPALRALAVCGFAVGCLLTALLIFLAIFDRN